MFATPTVVAKEPVHETRGAHLRASAPPRPNFLLIATRASSRGYDSTFPYMEQNETKRGALWLFLALKSAILLT